jgi:hypothetical protein
MCPIPTDPPMEPFADTVRWIETDPDPILDDVNLAVLFVRVGMARNALTSVAYAGYDASCHRTGAARTRDILTSLVISTAYTNEAIKLVRANPDILAMMARKGEVANEVLDGVDTLVAETHAASRILKRGRNQLGFHWDLEVIKRSVREYGRNAKVVWTETDADDDTVFRLAADVLAHAFTFDITAQHPTKEEQDRAIRDAFEAVKAAMALMTEFLSSALFGYLRTHGGVLRHRNPQPGSET